MVAEQAEVGTWRVTPVVGLPSRSAAELRTDFLLASTLFAAAFLLYAIPAILGRPLYEPSECGIGAVAREMIVNKNYVVPKLGNEIRLSKAPLPYWLVTATAAIIGGDATSDTVMARAVEIPAAFMGAATVFLVVMFGCAVFGRVAGVSAGLILGVTGMVTEFSRVGYTDATLMFFCTGMFCSAAWIVCTPRPGAFAALGLGLSLGLGYLSKWYLPLVLLAAPVLAEILIRRRFNPRKVVLMAVGLVVAATVAAPWLILVKQQVPSAWQDIYGTIATSIKPERYNQNGSWLYYIYKLAAGLLPWTPLLLAVWPRYLLKRRKEDLGDAPGPLLMGRESLRFFMLAAGLGLIGFYFWPQQQDFYLLPLFPPFALASGYVFSRLRVPGGEAEEDVAFYLIGLGIVGGIAILTLPFTAPLLKGSSFNGAQQALALFGPLLLGAVGVGFILVHFFCARQWVEGKQIKATLVLATLAYAALMIWGVMWSAKKRDSVALYVAAPRLKAELKTESKVYSGASSEFSNAELVYYLQRPIYTLEQLANEPVGITGDEAPQRWLLGSRESIKKLNLKQDPPSDSIAVQKLSKIEDWPKWAQDQLKEKK